MSHNVQHANPFANFTDTDDDFLVVTDHLGAIDDDLGIVFRRPSGDFGEKPFLIVCGRDARSWGGWEALIRIGGEDLYAFRELLNELPEEAFVRPADPVEEEFSCLRDGQGDWWIQADNGFWAPNFLADNQAAVRTLDYVIETYGIDDGTPDPPFWSPGDRVEHDGVSALIIYLRHVEGHWSRTVLGKNTGAVIGSIVSYETTDAEMRRLVEDDQLFYRVVTRKNAGA